MGIGLSLDEEIDLVKRAQKGDRAALHTLVKTNTPFAVKKGREYARRFGSHHEDDFIQEALRGLVKAISRYDSSRRLKLITYAVHWMESYMRCYALDNFSIVRYGTTQRERRIFFTLEYARRTLTHNGIPPTNEELAEYLNVTADQLADIDRRLHAKDASIDTPIDDDPTRTLANTFPTPGPSPEEEVTGSHDLRALRMKVTTALDQLSPRMRKIIEAYYMTDDDDVTLAQIGSQHGLTRERIRQIKNVGAQRLKKLLQKCRPGAES